MNDPKTFLEPLAGWILDSFAKLRNRPFVPHSLTKLHNLKLCRDLSGARTAVEIGSFKGVTTRRLSYLFDKVISVEIDDKLHDIARERCKDRKNIELLLGDGMDLLDGISARIDRGLIFLDGHFSGGVTGQGEVPEPVLQEVDVIRQHLDRYVAVIVDDFRLFGVEPGWPPKSQVLAKLEETFPSPDWTHMIMNDQFLVTRASTR